MLKLNVINKCSYRLLRTTKRTFKNTLISDIFMSKNDQLKENYYTTEGELNFTKGKVLIYKFNNMIPTSSIIENGILMISSSLVLASAYMVAPYWMLFFTSISGATYLYLKQCMGEDSIVIKHIYLLQDGKNVEIEFRAGVKQIFDIKEIKKVSKYELLLFYILYRNSADYYHPLTISGKSYLLPCHIEKINKEIMQAICNSSYIVLDDNKTKIVDI